MVCPTFERDGFYQAQLIRKLAVRHVTSWTGVELEGGPAPPTPDNIVAVMELYPVGKRFFQEVTLRQVLLNAAKNGCMDAPRRWHFQPGGGPEYCRACRGDSPLRPRRGGSGRTVLPLPRARLVSRQEHEAWDVLLACQGQLRLAPSGHVIGIDMNSALTLAAARGCDLPALSELLPAAEAGLVEALCAHPGPGSCTYSDDSGLS